MELFYTELHLLDRTQPVPGGAPGHEFSAAGAYELGLRDGIPFILDDSGRYDVHLNRFLREVAGKGGLSPNTARAYAYDYLSWSRFLRECRGPLDAKGRPLGKGIWEADKQDMIAYRKQRRIGAEGQGPSVEASTWNRSVSSLETLYSWGKAEGLIKDVPFEYERRRSAKSSGPWRSGPRNTALEDGARHDRVRFLSLAQYRVFRNVLQGRYPDGTEDPKCRMRTGERNATFADILASTGARVTEGGTLLDREIPSPEELVLFDGQRSIGLPLAPARCKGRRGRTVYISLELLRQADDFRRVERALYLERRRPAEAGSTIPSLQHLTFSRSGVFRQESGSSLSFAAMTGKDVRGALEPLSDGRMVPVQFFLTERGEPLPASAWWSIFSSASARCQKFGVDLYVTPHTLRHTFAIHYLSNKIRKLLGGIELQGYRKESARQAYLRVLSDPLRQLQRRLGHAWIETTFHYLDHIADAQDLVDTAFELWIGDSDDENNPDEQVE